MRKKIQVVGLLLVLILSVPNISDAQTTAAVSASEGDGFVSDPAIITENNPFTGLDLKIGKSAVDGSPNLTSAIIPFQLPEIPTGEEITDASLSVYVSFGREWIEDNCHVDLYALPFQSSADIFASDYYSGAFGSGNGTDIGIEDDYFKKNVVRGSKDTERFEETSTSANAALVSYLKAQYTAGAVAGDFVFLRLSIDLPEMTSSQYFGVHGGEGTNPAVLSITHQATENIAPTLSTIGNQTVQTTENLTISISATDPNGDALTFTVTDNLPSSATFTDHGDATATIQITDAGEVATFSDVVVTVSDGEFSDEETFTIDIIEQSANEAPVLNALGNLEVDLYGYGKWFFSATDVENDDLSFGLSGTLPPSAIFVDQGDGTAYLEVISEEELGAFSMELTVSDSEDTDTETFTVTVVERNSNQLMNLDAPQAPRFTITEKIWPAEHGEADVSYWDGDKTGVATITIDDNIEADHDWWLSMQDKYPNLKYTWFIIESQVSSWDKYQALVNAGNEVNGHDDCDINDGSDQDYRLALEGIQNEIATRTSTKASTYAYPCGKEEKGHVARDIYIGMRGVFGVLNHVNEIDYLALNSRSATNSNNDVDVLLDDSKMLFGETYYRGWYSTHYHSIAGTTTATENHLSYINDHASELWIAGFSEAAQYGQERDSHTLTVDEVEDFTIKFTLTDQMKDDAFDFPLTVKTRVSNTWKSVTAMQNGIARYAELITFENKKYVLTKAVPDRGQVIISGSNVQTANHAPVLSPIGNQSMLDAEVNKITITAEDPDGDYLYFSASDELPAYATLTDNHDGTATLQIDPSADNVGLVENIVITVNDGSDTDTEEISIQVVEFTGSIRYFDPNQGSNSNDGSESNPWASLASALSAGKVINDGDLLYLMNGEHGIPYISDKQYDNGVTVKPYHEAHPTMTGLIIARSSNWTFSNITVDGTNSSLAKEGFLVTSDASSTDLTFKNCLIQSAEESVTWTRADWYSKAKGGMDLRGNNIEVKYTTLKNTYHALSLRGDHSRASYNLIDNFAGDGMRGLGNYQSFTYNIVRDCYVEDYDTNHDDAFQTYILTSDPKSEGMRIQFNKILLFEDPITQFVIDNNLIGESMQGIIITDGYADSWVVENNLLVTDHWHGISLYAARNSRIQNNTVIKHPYFTDNKIPWILVDDSGKTGHTNFNNIIRNNLSSDITFDKFDETSTVEGNKETANLEDLNSYFVDYDGYNYHTKYGSPAIDQGVNTDLSIYDLAGNSRLLNGTVDAGAFEFEANGVPQILSIENQEMTAGESLTVNIEATDPNGGDLSLSIDNLPSFGVFTDQGNGQGTLEFSPSLEEDGVYEQISIEANNGSDIGHLFFDLIVLAKPNNSPVLDEILDQSLEEGEELSITLSATDADGDDLTFSSGNLTHFMRLTDNNDGTAILTFSPVTGDIGDYLDLNITVSDGIESVSQKFDLTVLASTNSAPELAAIANQVLVAGEESKLTITATDLEGDELVFSSTNLPAFVTLNDLGDGSAELTFHPTLTDVGSYFGVGILVSDVRRSDSVAFSIDVLAEAILSLSKKLDEQIALFPNPSQSGTFELTLPMNIEIETIQITNLSGQSVTNEILTRSSEAKQVLSNYAPLSRGHYLIRLVLSNQVLVKRFIVE